MAGGCVVGVGADVVVDDTAVLDEMPEPVIGTSSIGAMDGCSVPRAPTAIRTSAMPMPIATTKTTAVARAREAACVGMTIDSIADETVIGMRIR